MTTTAHTAGEGVAGPESAGAELLDIRTVAERLGCSPRHVRRLAERGAMPAPVKLGGLVRWRADDIRRWVADGCPRVRDWKRSAR